MMRLDTFGKALGLVFAGMQAIASIAAADTVKGVVSDSVNGMLLDSVAVSSEGVTTITDAQGAFTLVLPGSNAARLAPIRNQADVKWDAASGSFSWSGYSGAMSITVRSLQGNIVARYASGKNPGASTYSPAHLPQGVYTVAFQAEDRQSVYKISCLNRDGRQSFSLLSHSARSLGKSAATSADHVLSFAKTNFDNLTLTVAAGTQTVAAKMKSPYPLRNILHLFTDPGIPDPGPQEAPTTPMTWTPPATLPVRTGNGLAQHDMIYVGEGYRRICVVINGKLAWNYDTKNTYELDDIWMLSNGNILMAHLTYAEEITPKKEVVWHYDPPAGAEIHTCQPIGLDRVLFMQNQLPCSRLRLYNKVTKTMEIDTAIDSLAGKVHVQCRRIRLKPDGTYIAASLGNHKVFALGKDFKVTWSYATVSSAWSGVPLKNGNVMIQDEGAATASEVSPSGQVVWKWAKSEITIPAGAAMGNTQTCERLSTGNTVMFGNGGTNPMNIQAVEVTPAKQVVWMLQDWKDLGDATTAQFLDEPGYPEVPGQTNH